LSLNAEKNCVQNSGAKRRDNSSGVEPDGMEFDPVKTAQP
jgi:hypothetical protein